MLIEEPYTFSLVKHWKMGRVNLISSVNVSHNYKII